MQICRFCNADEPHAGQSAVRESLHRDSRLLFPTDSNTSDTMPVASSLVVLVWLEIEVYSRFMLEFEASLHAIRPAANHDKRCHEPDDLEHFRQLLRKI